MKLDKTIPVRSIFHKVVNYFLGILIGLFVLIVALVGFSQTATFREIARKQVLAILNDSIQGKINIEQIDGSIFTTVIVRNASLTNTTDTILAVKKVAVRINPLRLFVKNIYVKELELQDVTANLFADSQGVYNIAKVFPASTDTTSSEFPLSITLEKGIVKNINAVLSAENRKSELTSVPFLDMGNFRLNNFNMEFGASVNIKKKEFGLELFTINTRTNISGFAVNHCKGDIKLSSSGISIDPLILQTSKSDLTLKTNIKGLNLFGGNFNQELHTALLQLELDATPFHFADLQSIIGVTDYLQGPLQGKIIATGSLDDLQVNKLDLAIGDSKLLVQGRLKKILDGGTMQIDAAITNSNLNRVDVLQLLPIITIPEYQNYTSLRIDSLEYSGTPLTFKTKLKLGANTGLIRGMVAFDFSQENSTYDIALQSVDLNLTDITHHPITFNGTINAKGQNFSVATMQTEFALDGSYSIIGRQIYSKLNMEGFINNGDLDMSTLMKTEKDSLSGFIKVNGLDGENPGYSLSFSGKGLNLSDVSLDSTLQSNLNFHLSVEGKSFNLDSIEGDALLRIEKGYIGSNDLDSLEAKLAIRHKPDGSGYVYLNSDVADAEITGTYKLSSLLSVLQKEITQVNKSVTDKFSTYFPQLRKDIEAILTPKSELTKEADTLYAGAIDAKMKVSIKNLDKVSGFIKGKQVSFDGTIEANLKSDTSAFSFTIKSDIGFFKFVDTSTSVFIRDGACKILVSHPFNTYNFQSLKNTIALEADQAFFNSDVKQLFISTALDSSKMKVVFRTLYDSKMNIQLTGVTNFDNDSLFLQLGSIKYKYNMFELFNKVPATIYYTNGNFYLSRLALWRGDAKISLDGVFSLDQPMNLKLSAKNLKGYDLSYNLFGIAANEVIDNDLNIEASVQGTMDKPEMQVNFTADSITYHNVVYGSYIGKMDYADKKLSINLRLLEKKSGKQESRMELTGYLPMDLRFASVPERLLGNEPVSLQLQADKFNIASLGDLIPFISDVKGYVNSEITIGGTINNPVRKGYMKLENGTCLIDKNNLYYTASMDVTLDNREIIINHMKFSNDGKVKHKGTITGSGKIDVTDFTDPNILIRLSGDLSVLSAQRRSSELTVYGDAYVQSDGDIIYTMVHGKSFLKMPLLIKDAALIFPPTQETYTGAADNFFYRFPQEDVKKSNREIEIQKLLADYNERLRQSGQDKGSNYDFDYEIKVNMKDEASFVFVFSEEANQKLNAYLNGDILFERKSGIQNFQGELKVLEGSTLEFIKTFTATGSLRFESDVTNPYLDIVGVYKSYYSENDTTLNETKEEEVAVKVKLKGPVRDLAKSFSKSENNIAVYYGKNNIDKGNASTEYDNVDAIWFVIMGKFKKDLTAQDKTKAASQIDPITGTATSVASSLLGNLLNAYLGDVVRSVEVRNTGSATKFNLSGRYKDIKYTFGGSTNFLQDLSSASVRVEYTLYDNFIIRVERREAISNVNYSNEMINEVGLRYRFEF